MIEQKPKAIKLKDYVIKTQIEIGEVRHRIKTGNSYDQPFAYYYFVIKNPHGLTQHGGIKNKKQLFKELAEEFR
jgi:hypothetical protein